MAVNTNKQGYINGSDILVQINGKDAAHCQTHDCNYNAETKERAVKPASTLGISAGLWTEKGVNKLSITINGEGYRYWDETGAGFKTLMDAWAKGKPVTVTAFEREATATPYLVGQFVITSLKENNGANEDATFSFTLENSGQPTTWAPELLTGETLSEPAQD